jgi:glycosyltransferase involved in cell wall biosynthesis
MLAGHLSDYDPTQREAVHNGEHGEHLEHGEHGEHIQLSVILPVYNERENVPLVHEQVTAALEELRRPYEIIYVDDGSTDGSYAALEQLAKQDKRVVVIRFRRNFGQTAAMSAGIDHSQGDVIVLMDADLQNDPADIGRLMQKIDEGYDVVSGWRKHRKDKFLKRKLPSKIANGLISRVTKVRLHDYGCSLKAYRREVLDGVRLYGEMHRFIPAYASWAGAAITEIPVNHRARKYGKSKYGLSRTIRVVLDLITVKFLGSYSTKPLYWFGFISFFTGILGFLATGLLLWQRFTPPYVKIHDNPLLELSAFMFMAAVQLVLFGLLAELQMRTYFESQGKATYTLRTIVADGVVHQIVRHPIPMVSSPITKRSARAAYADASPSPSEAPVPASGRETIITQPVGS